MRDGEWRKGQKFVDAASLVAVLVAIGGTVWFGVYMWSARKGEMLAEAKLAVLQALPAATRAQLAAECERLTAGERRDFIAPEDWPPGIAALSPLHVLVGEDDVQLYFSGGHLPFLAVIWWPVEGKPEAGKGRPHRLEIVTDYEKGDRILWP